MRIIGVGHDVVELDRIRRSLEQFGESFLARCFTAEERRFCGERRDPVPGLAARFAAKEAGAKALGTGISGGVGFLEIEVRREEGQPPTLHFHRGAAELAERLGIRVVHVSLTHGRDIASAFVIAEGDE